jgi:hypothetical protein
VPNQKSIIRQHLLVAQIPARFSQEDAPLLEWRLGPSSEQNKNNSDVTLSQVFLTFDKSLNSPQNTPTMRLWLSGVLNGSRKRLLLAYSKEDFNRQLKATELQLSRTQLCQNTSVEFQIKVLPGIHFYQSDVPYVQINQDNIWTLWAPSPELLASTPGREKINPPPPSARNQNAVHFSQAVPFNATSSRKLTPHKHQLLKQIQLRQPRQKPSIANPKPKDWITPNPVAQFPTQSKPPQLKLTETHKQQQTLNN